MLLFLDLLDEIPLMIEERNMHLVYDGCPYVILADTALEIQHPKPAPTSYTKETNNTQHKLFQALKNNKTNKI
jgi:hypothetical protein